MKRLGNDIFIQRGETWSLDFEVENEHGTPYILLKDWNNPYMVITVTSALYEQKGDYRKSYWLDMNYRWIEKQDGTFDIVEIKRFTSNEALFLTEFTIDEILSKYPNIITDKESDQDVSNFLYFVDVNNDGNNIYKYIKDYDALTLEAEWEEYTFRVIKYFTTRDWIEQNYLYDIKMLAGQSIEEYIMTLIEDTPELPWTEQQTQEQIDRIVDKDIQNIVQEIWNSGQPLMPNFDVKNMILYPAKITVSADIQGG